VDLRRTDVDFRRRSLRIVADYVALRRNSDSFMFSARLQDDRGRNYRANLMVEPRHRQGRLVLFHDARRIKCATASRRVDYTTNRVVMVVPRHCLDRPRWVQFQGGSTSLHGRTLYFDDARSDRATFRDWSMRVRRG
jgi:hypothetical protein